MPTRRKTPEEKRNKALGHIQIILIDYDIQDLRDAHNEYKRFKREDLKKKHSLYNRYNRLLKVARDNETVEYVIGDMCQNCSRRDHPESKYPITFVQLKRNDIKNNQKFKHLDSTTTAIQNYTVCRECMKYLTTSGVKNDGRYVWCSYIWYLLTSEDVRNKYRAQIWIFLPFEWRLWWVQSIQETCPNEYSNLSSEEYNHQHIKDKTQDMKEWDDDIGSYMLCRLKSTTNKFLLPLIKCPWGCSEFMHKVGYLPMDIVFQKYLPQCCLRLYSCPKLHGLVVSAQDDFLRGKGDHDRFLFNPLWEVMPSIAYVEGKGQCMLTCNAHNGGTKKLYVHPCRWKHTLPAKRADQLSLVVVQPRILRPVKACKYTNTYTMFKQTGNFNGIDTCSASSYGDFSEISLLSSEAEARSIYNRPDINAHLSKLTKEKVITSFVEDGARKFAKQYSDGINYSKYVQGK